MLNKDDKRAALNFVIGYLAAEQTRLKHQFCITYERITKRDNSINTLRRTIEMLQEISKDYE